MQRYVTPSVTQQAAVLLSRAAQLAGAGRVAEAVAPLREAARLQPGSAAIQHDFGVACLESGLVGEAIAAFQAAIRLNPRFARAHLRLGMALESLGRIPLAIEAYRRAGELQPSLTEAPFRAANLLEILGRAEEAVPLFRRAAASGPKTGLGRIGAARALVAEQRDAEAERILRQALALDPANAMAQDMLGHVLADAGRFEDARDCYARAIAQAPLLAGSYYDLVRCRRITPEDGELIARMQAALAEPRLDAGQRLRVHLALGKAYDDLGDPATAMAHCDAADAIRAPLVAFDPAMFDALVDRIIARFTPDLIAQAGNRACEDPTPVLILGLPRSGTTLVEQILSSHPDVTAGGELPFWTRRGALADQAGPDATEPPFLATAAADCLRTLREISGTAARVTDKMPLNFVHAGLIHLALPRATIIHSRRSPIDTALSIHQTYFNPNLRFPTGGEALVAYVRAYRRLTEHWRTVLPADRFIEIEYEALTATPEPIIRALIAACGLQWDDRCLQPEHNVRVVKTPSKWQARQPIYRTAVQRWRRYQPWLGALGGLQHG